jgi:hypothetical protein
MSAKRKPLTQQLKESLAEAQKSNAKLGSELEQLKIEKETIRTNLAHSQLERLRLSALIDAEIEWLENPTAITAKERAQFLRKENQPK